MRHLITCAIKRRDFRKVVILYDTGEKDFQFSHFPLHLAVLKDDLWLGAWRLLFSSVLVLV